ncbi:MAG: formate--tetrahydrofolate ligase, partial [Clostridia bacterium]|nr:formate--tetrahydrofolate ligase [Clostridia bacterium]
KTALKLADYCITEAGFGSDLGAEKFFDIKCRIADLKPSAVVLVATVRALKYNGGVAKADLSQENIAALEKGIVNLGAHIDNIKQFGLPVIVAINRFPADSEAELDFIADYCEKEGVRFALSEVFSKGGDGGIELAKAVCEEAEKPSQFTTLYDASLSLKEKVESVAKNVYGAKGVAFTADAEKAIKALGDMADGLPICIAKTQYSLSDDPTKLGRPSDFLITVRDVRLSRGAGFAVVLTGDIMTMPGLPKVPAANQIDIDKDGNIVGLF